MASLTLDRLGKTYPGGFTAVHGISLDVPDGAFCVLVGPSGCGKSTVLRMIAGLETVSAGDIRIGARVVNQVEPAARDIAMVFQNYALYPHMRVYDNMAYGLRNRGTPKAEIETRVREAGRMLGLDALLDRYPRQLSGGQRQRVAMGRAIVRKPQVFLFDEPLSNLDAKLRVQMRVEIRRLQRQLGVTTVYVTHDQVEAMTMADVLVVMNGGRIEQVGTPLDIYRRPASRYVATFIGAPPMNILPAEVAEGGVQVGGRWLPADTGGLAPGATVEAGLRPEALHVAPDGIPFRVAFVEELGATRLLHGRLGEADLVVQVPAGTAPAEGDTIGLAPEPGAIHLFDAGSGQRLG
ncbi:ABC transporter ATP-binding protein [Methylobacterium oryzihabitans]|uniref:sn-glycerol-3-phosphate ABC transporter ATP-binding protein UgpC n=1 Tax=Methylobacterium oryzihabitans TaxID=2499852 RepID=A0A3S2YVV0_9HYPH|nr:sn-glycerol-3-phosphate ABC transporter ATP-binding protein UgpC [Methylobacterium oryzihabitans]RVU20554.1 sn-glycerol-3-phosphate ABC transporter ATP-binding protein UgpC [Methylobacterium oryzihabitans]